MKSHAWLVTGVCLSVSLLVGSAARAEFVPPVNTGDDIKVYGDTGLDRYNNGGAFRVDNLATANPYDVTSFCMELDEFLYFGNTYRVELGTEALRGGVNTDGGDPLDSRTAYLYSNFYHQTNGGDTWSTSDLQQTIWYIEEELPGHTLTSGAQALYDLASGIDHKDSLYDVRIMNLYDGREHAQSLLTVVPEPATVVLWGIFGVCGLMVLRRRGKSA